MNEPDQQPLNFLHLSDIHFRREVSGGVYDLDNDLRNELERDAEREVSTTLHKIDGILVTGDIAFAGNKDEFDVASGWLERICDLLGCTRDAVWTVPGNHDVERSVIDESATLATYHEKLRGTADIDFQIATYMKDRIAQKILNFSLKRFLGPRPSRKLRAVIQRKVRVESSSIL